MLWSDFQILKYFLGIYRKKYNLRSKLDRMVAPELINTSDFIRENINVNCPSWNLFNAAFDQLDN